MRATIPRDRSHRRFGSAWVLVALLCGCHGEGAPIPDTEAVPVAVGFTLATRGEISRTLTMVGETMATTALRLASPVSGRVTHLPLQPGDRVARAQPVARIIPTESDAALHGFALLDQAGVTDKHAQQALRHLATQELSLTAPFAALVAARFHYPGEQVAAGEALVELFDPTSLYVEAQAPIADAAQLRLGMPVQVTAGSSQALGQIDAVGGTVAAQSLTIPVRITLTTSLAPPLLHAPVGCRISLDTRMDALLIPRGAILSPTSDTHAMVMLAVDTRAERREVELGLRRDEMVEIRNGLSDGDSVIVEGAYGLPDGAPIRPHPAAETVSE